MGSAHTVRIWASVTVAIRMMFLAMDRSCGALFSTTDWTMAGSDSVCGGTGVADVERDIVGEGRACGEKVGGLFALSR